MNDVIGRRRRTFDAVADTRVDLAVIGGGINGVGVALDAATRGLTTVLLERDDLGVGTSSRSSKLIHGGLRYLEMLDFGLVKEALGERQLLVRLAPHLVTLRRFVAPVSDGRWQLPYIGTGLTLYDLLGGRRGGHFEYLRRDDVVGRFPGIDPSGVVGGFEYTDGVCDDARMVIAIGETARRHGADILTRAEVAQPVRSGDEWQIEVTDRLEGGVVTVRARAVVDVTGAFSLPGDGQNGAAVTASRGIHLVLAGERFPGVTGLTVRVPGRVVFLIPWGRRWLVGTTDGSHSGPIDRPEATEPEVEYLLRSINSVLAEDVTPDDVLATFTGVRPLAGAVAGDTVAASREHSVAHDGQGRVTVRGGKFTTYRVISGEAVDAVCGFLGLSRGSVTDRTEIVGAAPPGVLDEVVGDLMGQGLEPLEARWLVGRHGLEATQVAAVGSSIDGRARLHPEMPYLAAEAWWAVHREGALTIDDVLARRTRLAIETSDHGEAAAPLVAEVLAGVHNWDEKAQAEAVADYARSASREYGVP